MSDVKNEDLKKDENSEENLKDNNEETKEETKEETDSDDPILNELLKTKEIEIGELKDQLLRLQADFMNFRRRATNEKESAIAFGAECLAADILPSIDNFQRALQSEEDKESGFYKGVKMIYEELIKKLKDNGIIEIEALGKDFDPNFHDAVFMEESDEYEEGKVIEVIQSGYMIKDKVIRPVMVKVAK